MRVASGGGHRTPKRWRVGRWPPNRAERRGVRWPSTALGGRDADHRNRKEANRIARKVLSSPTGLPAPPLANPALNGWAIFKLGPRHPLEEPGSNHEPLATASPDGSVILSRLAKRSAND